MFKKLCATVLAAFVSVSAFACWVTQENFETNYIAGINYFKAHYVNSSSGVNNDITNAQYINGENGQFYSVSLPLTVWFKVSPRNISVDGSGPQPYYLRKSILFYKVLPGNVPNASAKWRVAKQLDLSNANWNINFNTPIKLFGNNVITKSLITKNGDTINSGDGIVLAWYIVDNFPGAVSNGEMITAGSSDPQIYPDVTESYSKTYSGSKYAPLYTARVVYNGKNIINIGR